MGWGQHKSLAGAVGRFTFSARPLPDPTRPCLPTLARPLVTLKRCSFWPLQCVYFSLVSLEPLVIESIRGHLLLFGFACPSISSVPCFITRYCAHSHLRARLVLHGRLYLLYLLLPATVGPWRQQLSTRFTACNWRRMRCMEPWRATPRLAQE